MQIRYQRLDFPLVSKLSPSYQTQKQVAAGFCIPVIKIG
jgi:hypothetical protein